MKGFPRRVVRVVCQSALLASGGVGIPYLVVGAQVIHGKAVEYRSDLPIAKAQVTLLDDRQRETTVTTVTDSLGKYSVTVPAPGRYSIRLREPGYDEFTSVLATIGKSDTLEMDLWPQANADLLDSLLKVAGPSQRTPEGRAFDRRLKAHLGHVIVREQITQLGYFDLEEVVSKAFDGLQVRRYAGQLQSMCYRGCCTFSVFKNGAHSFRMTRAQTSTIQLQSVLATRTEHVYAVEFYVGQAEMPPEYFGETAVACGVLGYWTRAPG